MRSLWTLLTICMVAMSLFATSLAHATEVPLGCVDTQTAVDMGHADGDADQVPADGDKGYPHHHGGCHGHQVVPKIVKDAPFARAVAKARLTPAPAYFLPAATADPALRPPQA
ncbi:hypothetical protein FHR20_001580 [Sphingomonas leidyi]|uniref:DUF2946 domain-containing protein n=1 Tax=Sphingomonas leidyi TaxID=68569 RepID=A0A7X5ZVE1_9SPHN|nr:hypothetical protein [Sphingomonas leidyi]NIJ64649.1 hypothetical protein [Sphingomonas leidyi]